MLSITWILGPCSPVLIDSFESARMTCAIILHDVFPISSVCVVAVDGVVVVDGGGGGDGEDDPNPHPPEIAIQIDEMISFVVEIEKISLKIDLTPADGILSAGSLIPTRQSIPTSHILVDLKSVISAQIENPGLVSVAFGIIDCPALIVATETPILCSCSRDDGAVDSPKRMCGGGRHNSRSIISENILGSDVVSHLNAMIVRSLTA